MKPLIEPINGKLREELLDRSIFSAREEAWMLVERWRQNHNQVCPYSKLGAGHRPPK